MEECTYRSYSEIWLFKPQSLGLPKDTISSVLADSPKINVFNTKGRSTSILDRPFWTWEGGAFEEDSVIYPLPYRNIRIIHDISATEP